MAGFLSPFKLNSKSAERRRKSIELATLVSERLLLSEEDSTERIDELIDDLVSLRVNFDPTTSLRSGLWVSAYTRGANEPRWKRFGKILKPFSGLRNLSGQSYDTKQGTVLNYAEVFGQKLVLTASGTFAAETSVGKDAKISSRCPADFSVQITGGAIGVGGVPFKTRGGALTVQLPISGPGLVRVLFADEHSRVLVSPRASPDKWEEAGLLVVQIPAAAVNSQHLAAGWVDPS